MISKEREIFKNIYNKKLDKIGEIANKVNYDDLKHVTESRGLETDFSVKTKPIGFLNVKTKKITTEEEKASQEDFNKYLNMIRKGKKQKNKKIFFSNISILFVGRNDAIKFRRPWLNDCCGQTKSN